MVNYQPQRETSWQPNQDWLLASKDAQWHNTIENKPNLIQLQSTMYSKSYDTDDDEPQEKPKPASIIL